MAVLVKLQIRKMPEAVYGDPQSVFLNVEDKVVVHTENGHEWGIVLEKEQVVKAKKEQIVKVVRKLTDKDYEILEYIQKKERAAIKICLSKIEKLGLVMKLTTVEYTFDRSKLFIYYTAEGRVDFRELIKELSSALKTKIQMVQIGVRDEAKMVGGIGHCGRMLCCGTFLKKFKPVVIDMAKDQGLMFNPSKISGLCGRLMCCLAYEHDFYKSVFKKMPDIGKKLETKDGKGTVSKINILREEFELMFEDGSAKTYAFDEYKKIKK